jgi:hypothetical protein
VAILFWVKIFAQRSVTLKALTYRIAASIRMDGVSPIGLTVAAEFFDFVPREGNLFG